MFKKLAKMVMAELSKISVQQEDVVGVDITPEYIRVTQLDNEKDDWVLSRLGWKFLGESSNLSTIREYPADYVNKLSQIVEANKLTKSNAAVSIPVSSAIVKVVTVPLMTDEELQEAIDTSTLWENVLQFSEALNEYSIFWQIIKREPEKNTLDLLFVASKLEDVECYLDIVRKAGLNPVVVDVRCFSMRCALQLRKDLVDSGSPVVLVEIGRHENYVLIINNDSPYISDIYVSDKDRETLSESATDASKCKVTHERLAMQINQVLNIYRSKYKISPINSILFTTTLPAYERSIEYLNEFMPGINIQAFDATNTLVIPENLKEKITSESNKTAFSSSLGLATRKLDVFGYYQYVTGTSNINLMPNRHNIKSEEKIKFISKWGIIAFALLFVVIALVTFIGYQAQEEEVNEKLIEFNALEFERETKQMELDELREKTLVIDRILSVSKEVRSNQDFMYSVLHAITRSVPNGISLKTIDYANEEIEITGVSVSDQNIIGLIERLERSSPLKQASLLNMSIEKNEKHDMKSFAIRVTLNVQKDSEPGNEVRK